jgi:hypothetical protein
MLFCPQVGKSRQDLSQTSLLLHLFGPDGHPAMAPLLAPVNHGSDMWFARDPAGKTDSASAGEGGMVKVCSPLCNIPGLNDKS